MQPIIFFSGNYHNPHNDRRFMPVLDRTKVTGVLEGNAKVLKHADGSAAISVRLRQPGGLPILAERSYGHGPEADAQARADAAHLVHGRRCQATGYGLDLNWSDQKTLTLELTACTRIAAYLGEFSQ